MSERQPAVRSAERVGDQERERVAGLLGEHVGAGRLALSEFDERVRSAYAATTRGELAELLADLPGPRRGGDAPAPRPVHERGRGHRVALAAVWSSWLAAGVICLMIWAMVSLAQGEAGYFWPIWVIGPWGAMLLFGTVTGNRACGSRHAPHRA